jgi:hypothetical protein
VVLYAISAAAWICYSMSMSPFLPRFLVE